MTDCGLQSLAAGLNMATTTDPSVNDTALIPTDVAGLQIFSGNQTPSALTPVHITNTHESDTAGELKDKIKHLEELLVVKKTELDDMSSTLIQYKQRLALSTDDDKRTGSDLGQHISQRTNFYTCKVIVRSPGSILLDVSVHIQGNESKSAFNFALSASRCSKLSDLRSQLVSAGSEDSKLQAATGCKDSNLLDRMKDLDRVIFRLEEDGHVARMNITPSRVDRSCAFPDIEYEAWYYRNILRGNLEVYKVEVRIVG